METKILEALLTFFTALLTPASTCIWQIIVIGTLFGFRKQISSLLQRISKVKFKDSEISFQPEERDAPTVLTEKNLPRSKDAVKLFGMTDFYTVEQIREIVRTSGLVDVDNKERIKAQLLLFRTPRQKTWLVTTNKQLFCLLDDDKTRATRRIIQWYMPLQNAFPIVAKEHPSKTTVGLLRIDGRKNWLYSLSLHPDPVRLEKDIETMISISQNDSN